MPRSYVRVRKHERVLEHAPHGHWNATTLIVGISSRGAITPMMLDGPMDTLAFEANLEQVLIPALPEKAIVIIDNLSAHKSQGVEVRLKKAGTPLRYLPPYSQDFNPIELMWSKLKTFKCAAKVQTQDELKSTITDAFRKITSDDAQSFF